MDHANVRDDFQRDLLLNFRDGFITSEAVRAWLRAPALSLLDDETVQARYLDPAHRVDQVGQPLAKRTRNLVDFLVRDAALGSVALVQREEETLFVVRDDRASRLKHRVALVQDWAHGLTVYSRWRVIDTYFYQEPAPESVLAQLIRLAQQDSARRPPSPKGRSNNPGGADYLDPALPKVTLDGNERWLEPDLVDRLRDRLVRFFS